MASVQLATVVIENNVAGTACVTIHPSPKIEFGFEWLSFGLSVPLFVSALHPQLDRPSPTTSAHSQKDRFQSLSGSSAARNEQETVHRSRGLSSREMENKHAFRPVNRISRLLAATIALAVSVT
ncbi:hypothetical protein CDD82_1445 [Ophiocordyceps australis]|uniref:Uncharacterized protein n=1 Tax=Ophiocordyceps australis TaxID=1399860 RepID=A0A2C5YIM6_9HYPO|nr:hypothetical protein CDD82_1445 [Ophiocordyceps australis]